MSASASGSDDDAPGSIRRVVEWIGRVARTLTPAVVRRRYAAKFAISMAVVVLVVAAIGGASYVQIQSNLREDTRSELQSRAAMQATAVGNWVEELQVQTRFISAAEELRGTEPTTVNAYLGTARNLGTLDIVAVHVVDRERGRVVGSTTVDLRGRSVSSLDRPWERPLRAVAAYDSVASVVAAGERSYRRDNETVLAFASPVADTDRAVVVVGSIQSEVDTFGGEGVDARTTVVTADGSTVLGTGATVGSGSLTDPAAFDSAVENGTVGAVETSRAVRAYAPVSQTDWVVAVGVPTREAYAIGRSVGTNVLAIVAGSVLALGFVATALGWQTVVPLTRLRRRAETMQEGDLDVDLSTDRIDEIGRLYGSFDEMRTSLRSQFDETESALSEAEAARADAEQARTEAEAARERAEALSERLRERAQQFGETMQACADGQLHRRLDERADNDAMVEIATAFNEMMDEIEGTVAEVRSFADEVADRSVTVADRADAVDRQAARVDERVRDISDGAGEQTERLERMADEMATLSANVEEVAASTTEVAETAQRSVERGRDGQASAAAAIEEMDELEARATEAVEQMDALGDEVEAIGDVADLIADIADQTSMLALNANIEAANAGGDGAGFAVVADEVKGLAAETREATDDIGDRIEAVQAQTDSTAEAMTEMRAAVAAASDAVGEARTALDDIVTEVEATDDVAREIDRATGEQAETTQQVAGDIDEVADISRTVTDRAASAAESVADQGETVGEVADDAETLQRRATALSARLDDFEVAPERGDAEGADGGPGGDGPLADPSEDGDDGGGRVGRGE
ncbi:methyl-accepting chemotaxis protein [Haloarcula litorea]|uniref:methyl-accepting chemotaxis protein n=1 Tax=Haloarcula litorea TaxID=3032579 RepID=UPI0023E8E1E7|nr:methyl-accepting chemotaxis protein [Halomicroarcula sp. GDY20]